MDSPGTLKRTGNGSPGRNTTAESPAWESQPLPTSIRPEGEWANTLIPVTRIIRLVAMAFGLSFAGSVVAAGSAAADCVGIHSNYFAGAITGSGSANIGARATNDVPSSKPPTCGDRDFTDPWVMIYAPGSRDYAQIGFGMDYLTTTGNPLAGSPRFIGFAQYTRPGQSPYTRVFGAPSLGGSPDYENVLYYSDDHIHMKWNDTQYLETDYNVLGYWSDSWEGQYLNEASVLASSHVWGTSGDKLAIRAAENKNVNNGWVTPDTWSRVNGNTSRWNSDLYVPSPGTKGVRVWND